MVGERTLWQRLIVSDEDLDQTHALQALYDRTCARVRYEALVEKMRAGLESEFDKLIVNRCPHLNKKVMTPSAPLGRLLFSEVACLSCGARVEAHADWLSGLSEGLRVTYYHSTPSPAFTATVHATSFASSALTTMGILTWEPTKTLKNVTLTISGTTVKDFPG